MARSLPEAHGKNVVNVIVVDFRGFDTLGEITVLLVAAMGVVALVQVGRRRGDDDDPDDEPGDDDRRTTARRRPAGRRRGGRGMSRRPTRDPLMDRRSMILDVVVRAEFHVLLVVSVYLLFAGHNAPGGGFVGGLVAASACALRMAAHGPAELRRSFRLHPMTVLGLGPHRRRPHRARPPSGTTAACSRPATSRSTCPSSGRSAPARRSSSTWASTSWSSARCCAVLEALGSPEEELS